MKKPGSAPSPTNPWTAVFDGYASIQDVTNPAQPIWVQSAAVLQVNLTDYGSGTSGTLGITVWDRLQQWLWFSSGWNGTTTVQQAPGGGNLSVH